MWFENIVSRVLILNVFMLCLCIGTQFSASVAGSEDHTRRRVGQDQTA